MALRRRTWASGRGRHRAFATRYLSSSNALGRQLRIPGFTSQNRWAVTSAQSTAWRQIIGVVGDARNDGVDRPVVPAIYLPYTAVIPSNVQFFVRTQGDPLTYLHSMRAAIALVASDQQISNSTFNGTFTLNEAIERDAQYSVGSMDRLVVSRNGGVRVLIVWLYNNTGKCVFAAAVFHTMMNVSWQLFPIHGSHFDERINGVILALAAAVASNFVSIQKGLTGPTAL